MTGVGFYCAIASLLWGVTNPFIKNSTKSISNLKTENFISTFLNEIKYLIGNRKYVLLFFLNQCGSVLYFFALHNVELSLIVPLVNALTFIVTGFVGTFIGENFPNLRTLSGLIFITVGITFCVLDKI